MNGLKSWLKKRKMTQGELAAELGLSRVYVSRVANDDDKPGEAFMWRFYRQYGQDAICEAFDVERTA